MNEFEEVLSALVGDPDLTKFAAQAVSARGNFNAAQLGDVQVDVVELHTNLVHNRAHLDTLQHLTAGLILVKGKAAKSMRNARAELDDAYMKAATKVSVGFSDYASAKEKDAAFMVECVGETIAFRKAENFFRDVEAVSEFVRVILRGCEQSHRDLETRIRLISLAGQLDR